MGTTEISRDPAQLQNNPHNYGGKFTEVTKELFFKRVTELSDKQIDIHPQIKGSYEQRGKGYVTHWVMPSSRQLMGITESGCYAFTEPRYFLANA